MSGTRTRRSASIGETLLSTEEAARALRVSPSTLAIWRIRGRGCGLKFLKLGRSVRYAASDIEKFLESRRRA
jgi:excisionase family DNA binding protein